MYLLQAHLLHRVRQPFASKFHIRLRPTYLLLVHQRRPPLQFASNHQLTRSCYLLYLFYLLYLLYLPFPLIPCSLAYTNHFIYCHLIKIEKIKRRKLSADTLQQIIDDWPIDLEDFDVDDSISTLPSNIFDIDDFPLSSQLRKALEKARQKKADAVKRRKEKTDAKKAEEKRLQKEKRAAAGKSEPICSSCKQEGHQRSSCKEFS